MDISGDHRGCNDLRGRYTIHELTRAPDGFLAPSTSPSSSTFEFEEPTIRPRSA